MNRWTEEMPPPLSGKLVSSQVEGDPGASEKPLRVLERAGKGSWLSFRDHSQVLSCELGHLRPRL